MEQHLEQEFTVQCSQHQDHHQHGQDEQSQNQVTRLGKALNPSPLLDALVQLELRYYCLILCFQNCSPLFKMDLCCFFVVIEQVTGKVFDCLNLQCLIFCRLLLFDVSFSPVWFCRHQILSRRIQISLELSHLQLVRTLLF